MTSGNNFDVDFNHTGEGTPFSIRAINSMGGMGKAMYYPATDAIENISTSSDSLQNEYYTLDGRKVNSPQHGIYIKVTKDSQGKKTSEKVIL